MHRQNSYLDLAPSTPTTKHQFGDFHIEKELIGVGTFSEVHKARRTSTGQPAAVKIYGKARLTALDRLRIDREIQAMRSCDHPNIVKLYHVEEDAERVMIFMELYDTDLFNLSQSRPKQVQRRARSWMAQLVSAVEHIHGRGIVHRDIKLENVLVSESTDCVALTDFGLCDFVANEPLTQFCGSPAYASPELINRQPYRGACSDVWALGVLLYAMLVGDYPFVGDSIRELYEKAAQPQRYLQFPLGVSAHARDLISRMLVVRPEDRLTLPQIRKHKFLRSGLLVTLRSTVSDMLPWTRRASEKEISNNASNREQTPPQLNATGT